MSVKTAGEFLAKTQEDGQLQTDYLDVLKGLAKDKADKSTQVQRIIDFATANGYDFSADEFEKAYKKGEGSKELSEEDLAAVSGGDDVGVAFVATWGESTGVDFCLYIGTN